MHTDGNSNKVGIVFTGGTISSENMGGGLKPTEGGIKHLRNVMNRKGDLEIEYAIPRLEDLTEVLYDSSELYTSERIAILREVEKFLQRKDISGVVVTHGTDTINETANMAWIGLRGLRKPVIFTGSIKAPGEKGYDGDRNLQNSCLIAGTKDLSNVFLYFDNVLLFPSQRKHNFYPHDPDFEPGYIFEADDIIDPVIRVGKRKLFCLRRAPKPHFLDYPFTFPRGERNKVRIPVIRGIIPLYIEQPEEIQKSGFKFPFLVEYAVKRHDMINSEDDCRYEVLRGLESRASQYGIDLEKVKHFWDSRYTTFDPDFDLDSILIINYSTNPEFYERILRETERIRGVVLRGSGAGHVRLRGSKSFEGVLSILKERGIPTVMCTETREPVSFKYEVGRELLKRGYVISGGMKEPEEAQMRLAHIVHPHHEKIINETASTYKIDPLMIKHMLFVGGGMFRPYERELYEKETGVDTRVNLLDSLFTFGEVATLTGQQLYLSKADIEYF